MTSYVHLQSAGINIAAKNRRQSSVNIGASSCRMLHPTQSLTFTANNVSAALAWGRKPVKLLGNIADKLLRPIRVFWHKAPCRTPSKPMQLHMSKKSVNGAGIQLCSKLQNDTLLPEEAFETVAKQPSRRSAATTVIQSAVGMVNGLRKLPSTPRLDISSSPGC